ncbi:TPA: hypothetical protein I7721_20350 [Vibrio vulnificus]|nr:hypothetical protein [Vibrio vulnificus]
MTSAVFRAENLIIVVPFQGTWTEVAVSKFNCIRWAVILIAIYNVVLCVGIIFMPIPIGNRYSFFELAFYSISKEESFIPVFLLLMYLLINIFVLFLSLKKLNSTIIVSGVLTLFLAVLNSMAFKMLGLGE